MLDYDLELRTVYLTRLGINKSTNLLDRTNLNSKIN